MALLPLVRCSVLATRVCAARHGTSWPYRICCRAVGDFHHPLAAVYRRDVLPVVRQLLTQNQLRPFFLFEQVPRALLKRRSWPTWIQPFRRCGT